MPVVVCLEEDEADVLLHSAGWLGAPVTGADSHYPGGAWLMVSTQKVIFWKCHTCRRAPGITWCPHSARARSVTSNSGRRCHLMIRQLSYLIAFTFWWLCTFSLVQAFFFLSSLHSLLIACFYSLFYEQCHPKINNPHWSVHSQKNDYMQTLKRIIFDVIFSLWDCNTGFRRKYKWHINCSYVLLITCPVFLHWQASLLHPSFFWWTCFWHKNKTTAS